MSNSTGVAAVLEFLKDGQLFAQGLVKVTKSAQGPCTVMAGPGPRYMITEPLGQLDGLIGYGYCL